MYKLFQTDVMTGVEQKQKNFPIGAFKRETVGDALSMPVESTGALWLFQCTPAAQLFENLPLFGVLQGLRRIALLAGGAFFISDVFAKSLKIDLKTLSRILVGPVTYGPLHRN
ncbi:MAG: hypothetical protein LBB52_04785 [Desulfovibrio sp.]|nr:hypothetical protein [Desulfovibrio sp.]